MRAIQRMLWMCQECSTHYHQQELAEVCCEVQLCECGAERAKGYSCCFICRRGRGQARELAKPRAIGHDGPVCVAGGDTYWATVEEWLEEQGGELPELQADIVHPCHVRSCADVDASIHAEAVIEWFWSEVREEAPEELDTEDLERRIREWLDKQPLEWWEADTSRVIVLGEVLS